jgi:hypothetical protein
MEGSISYQQPSTKRGEAQGGDDHALGCRGAVGERERRGGEAVSEEAVPDAQDEGVDAEHVLVDET